MIKKYGTIKVERNIKKLILEGGFFMGFLSTNVEKRREMILNGNILNTLLLLSFPTLLMGMVQSLIPLSDGLFLNRTSGYLVAAAVGFGQPL